MRRILLLTVVVLCLAAVTALANMQAVDEEALADIQASMGARLDMRGGRAVSSYWGYEDSNGAAGVNGNRGYLFFGSVYFSAAGGTAGTINLWNMTLDIGAEGTTEMAVIGFPSIDGRISINDIRIGNANDHNAQVPFQPTVTWNTMGAGSPVGSIYLENVTFAPGSALMMWGQ